MIGPVAGNGRVFVACSDCWLRALPIRARHRWQPLARAIHASAGSREGAQCRRPALVVAVPRCYGILLSGSPIPYNVWHPAVLFYWCITIRLQDPDSIIGARRTLGYRQRPAQRIGTKNMPTLRLGFLTVRIPVIASEASGVRLSSELRCSGVSS